MSNWINENNRKKLEKYLSAIEKVFDVDNILKFEMTVDSINEYFENSNIGYDLVHSKAGSIHLAISDDEIFRKEDYNKQLKYIETYINLYPIQSKVLEIGSGKGFNIGNLAKNCTHASFTGLELTEIFFKEASKKYEHLVNVEFVLGNFHNIPFNKFEFDVVFDVEAICYAQDYKCVLSDIYRVLKPNGTFISFNGFRDREFQSLDDDLKKAVRLVELSMAVDVFAEIGKFITIAKEIGFEVLLCNNISQKIMPNLIKYEEYANKSVLNYPRLSRFLSRRLSQKILLQNAISALLMPITVSEKAHGYYFIVLKKVQAS